MAKAVNPRELTPWRVRYIVSKGMVDARSQTIVSLRGNIRQNKGQEQAVKYEPRPGQDYAYLN